MCTIQSQCELCKRLPEPSVSYLFWLPKAAIYVLASHKISVLAPNTSISCVSARQVQQTSEKVLPMHPFQPLLDTIVDCFSIYSDIQIGCSFSERQSSHVVGVSWVVLENHRNTNEIHFKQWTSKTLKRE